MAKNCAELPFISSLETSLDPRSGPSLIRFRLQSRKRPVYPIHPSIDEELRRAWPSCTFVWRIEISLGPDLGSGRDLIQFRLQSRKPPEYPIYPPIKICAFVQRVEISPGRGSVPDPGLIRPRLQSRKPFVYPIHLPIKNCAFVPSLEISLVLALALAVAMG
jgi:hypothetical protein